MGVGRGGAAWKEGFPGALRGSLVRVLLRARRVVGAYGSRAGGARARQGARGAAPASCRGCVLETRPGEQSAGEERGRTWRGEGHLSGNNAGGDYIRRGGGRSRGEGLSGGWGVACWLRQPRASCGMMDGWGMQGARRQGAAGSAGGQGKARQGKAGGRHRTARSHSTTC